MQTAAHERACLPERLFEQLRQRVVARRIDLGGNARRIARRARDALGSGQGQTSCSCRGSRGMVAGERGRGYGSCPRRATRVGIARHRTARWPSARSRLPTMARNSSAPPMALKVSKPVSRNCCSAGSPAARAGPRIRCKRAAQQRLARAAGRARARPSSVSAICRSRPAGSPVLPPRVRRSRSRSIGALPSAAAPSRVSSASDRRVQLRPACRPCRRSRCGNSRTSAGTTRANCASRSREVRRTVQLVEEEARRRARSAGWPAGPRRCARSAAAGRASALTPPRRARDRTHAARARAQRSSSCARMDRASAGIVQGGLLAGTVAGRRGFLTTPVSRSALGRRCANDATLGVATAAALPREPTMQRRTLLKLGLGATVVLAAAGGGIALLEPGVSDGRLRAGARAVMHAVARAVLDGALPAASRRKTRRIQAHLLRLDVGHRCIPGGHAGRVVATAGAAGQRAGPPGPGGPGQSDWPEASVGRGAGGAAGHATVIAGAAGSRPITRCAT